MEQLKGVKVVERKGGRLLSILVADEATTEYKPNVKTVRGSFHKHGPLSVFDTLENARKFFDGFEAHRELSQHDWEIWSCTYEPSHDACSWFVASPTKTYRDVSQFDGMVWADSITLGRRIEL